MAAWIRLNRRGTELKRVGLMVAISSNSRETRKAKGGDDDEMQISPISISIHLFPPFTITTIKGNRGTVINTINQTQSLINMGEWEVRNVQIVG